MALDVNDYKQLRGIVKLNVTSEPWSELDSCMSLISLFFTECVIELRRHFPHQAFLPFFLTPPAIEVLRKRIIFYGNTTLILHIFMAIPE